jgi:hypothetical protein
VRCCVRSRLRGQKGLSGGDVCGGLDPGGPVTCSTIQNHISYCFAFKCRHSVLQGKNLKKAASPVKLADRSANRSAGRGANRSAGGGARARAREGTVELVDALGEGLVEGLIEALIEVLVEALIDGLSDALALALALGITKKSSWHQAIILMPRAANALANKSALISLRPAK